VQQDEIDGDDFGWVLRCAEDVRGRVDHVGCMAEQLVGGGGWGHVVLCQVGDELRPGFGEEAEDFVERVGWGW
jgi:hypothetical protein